MTICADALAARSGTSAKASTPRLRAFMTSSLFRSVNHSGACNRAGFARGQTWPRSWRLRHVLITCGTKASVVQRPAMRPRRAAADIPSSSLAECCPDAVEHDQSLDATRESVLHDHLLTGQYLGFYTFLTTFSCGGAGASYHIDSSVIRRIWRESRGSGHGSQQGTKATAWHGVRGS